MIKRFRIGHLLPVAALATALFTATPALAAPQDDAAILTNPPGMSEGDADKALDAILGVIERDRGGPLAQAGTRVARDFLRDSKNLKPLSARLAAMVERGHPQGDADEAIRRFYAQVALQAGDMEARLGSGLDAGYLGEFLICGPFGTGSRAAVDRAYTPERGIDLDKEMIGKAGPLRWMDYESLGLGEIIEPFQYLRPTTGTAYALSQVKCDAARPVVLKITSWGSFKVWVNGVEVARMDRLRDEKPRTIWVPATLGSGWNRVLVKTVGSSGFALKLCNADSGLAITDLEEEAGRVLHPSVDPLAAPESVGYRNNYDLVLATAPASAHDHVVRAMLALNYSDQWQAYEDLEDAAKKAPKDAGVLYRQAAFVEGFNQMPEPRWRKNRARGIYEDVLELHPGHVPAAVSLAEILDGEDRTEEALAGLKALPEAGETPADPEAARSAAETRAAMERSRTLFPGLDKLLEQHPDYARGWYVRSSFCNSRDWIKEAEDAAEKAIEVNPRFTPAIGFLLRRADRAGNMDRAEALCKQMVAADHGNYGIRSRLVEFAHRRGNTDEALAMLDQLIKDNPSDFRVRGRRIDILASLRRYDEAIAALRELAKFSPLEPSYPQKIGQFLRYKGDNDGAREAWGRALALEPANGQLRRELGRMDGGDFDFARPYMVDAEEMWRNCGGQEKYPKALAVHLVDHQVIRVNEDGSYSAITHNAYKILNEQGREKYQNVYVPGTLLEVRAVSPDGEVFLPIQARGQSFTIEGIQEGWMVEWRYLQDHGRDENGFDSGGWYFQDPNFGTDGDPVLLSRLVVDMPADMKVQMQLRNYGTKPEETVAEGRRVFDFQKTDMPRIEDEPRMPSADELLPFVHFYTHWQWDDVNLAYMGDVGGFRSSPVLERKAAELTEGIDNPLDKARALYDFVNEEITGNSGGWSSTGTLLEKSGDRYGLFGSLLVAAGIKFDPVRISTGDQSRKDWVKIDTGLFGSRGLVLYGKTRSERAYIFRFSRHTPFGRLPLNVRGKPAFIPRPEGPEMFQMPTGDDFDVQSRAEVTVTLGETPADTKFNLLVVQPTEGWYGYKEQVKDSDEDNRRKNTVSILGSHVTTPDLKNYAYPGLESAGEPFKLMADGALPYQLREEGGEWLVALGPRPVDLTGRYIARPEREYDLIIGGTRIQKDTFTYDLGSHWRVRTLPEAHIAASKIGTYSLSVLHDGDTVRIERIIRFSPCRYTPSEYGDFIAWCRGIDTAEEQKIILEEKE